MKPKSISILLSILLILTVLGSTLSLSFPPVFANPVCGATIKKNTTLTGNIGPCSSGSGLIIDADSITLNCAGHTISGTGNAFSGIYVLGITKVTVEKCKVTGFEDGFILQASSSNTLTGNTANSNEYGFVLTDFSGSNTLTKNTANKNTDYGYYDTSVSSSAGVPHWDTANSYKGDKGSGNGLGLAGGNPNIATATSPF